MKFNYNLTEEEKVAVKLGFLPSHESILAILPNTSFYAVFEDKTDKEMEVYRLLVAWGYLKNGICMPLIYDDQFHTFRNPEFLANFIRIGGDPDDEEEVILDDIK